jgi:hypothetical protein
MLDSLAVRTSDGRDMGPAQWGDPVGMPVFVLHGTPGSRYLRHVGGEYERIGIHAGRTRRLSFVRLSQPFTRLDDPTRHDGFGLGLAKRGLHLHLQQRCGDSTDANRVAALRRQCPVGSVSSLGR